MNFYQNCGPKFDRMFKQMLLVFLMTVVLAFCAGLAFGQESPVQPVSEQPLTGPVTDTIRAIKELRAEHRNDREAMQERSRLIDGKLREAISKVETLRSEQRKDRKAMQGFLSNWQTERTERKRIQVEIEEHRAAAEIAASEAREASANNRIWRFGIVLVGCVTAFILFRG